jgi:hypothetical protein
MSLNRYLLIVVAAVVPAARADTIYVDDDAAPGGDGVTWDTAYRYLQDALYEAVDAASITEIRVAQGTYRPDQDEGGNVTPGNRQASFYLVDGVALRGGYAGVLEPDPDMRDIALFETILSGDLPGPIYHDSYHVVRAASVDELAVLDGFTITGGRAWGSCCVNDRGGGMYLSSSNVTVVACTIEANKASNVAGGLWLSYSSATFIDCAFEENTVYPGNSGAAIQNVFGSDLTLIRCLLRDNTLGAYTTGGGAIFSGGFSGPAITVAIDCVFTGNDGSAGGAILNNGYGTFVNCLFMGNSALGDGYGNFTGKGGAIANIGQATVVNCTIFGNSAQLSGGGLYTGGGSSNSVLDNLMVAANCIVWANTAGCGGEEAEVVMGPEAALEIDYSCVQDLTGQYGGAGNIGDDPGFVDPDWPGLDFRLSPGSPCIDAGDNTAVPAGITTDLDGKPRFVGDPLTPDTGAGDCPSVDMGTYEFQPEFPCPWDLDCDANVFVMDLLRLLADWGSCADCPADFNDDGLVNVADLLALIGNFGPCPGVPCIWDVNNDGVVDQSDVQQVLDNFGPCGGCPEDVNGDGVVNGQDVAAVARHFGPCP